jgi:hypothetical protein
VRVGEAVNTVWDAGLASFTLHEQRGRFELRKRAHKIGFRDSATLFSR